MTPGSFSWFELFDVRIGGHHRQISTIVFEKLQFEQVNKGRLCGINERSGKESERGRCYISKKIKIHEVELWSILTGLKSFHGLRKYRSGGDDNSYSRCSFRCFIDQVVQWSYSGRSALVETVVKSRVRGEEVIRQA